MIEQFAHQRLRRGAAAFIEPPHLQVGAAEQALDQGAWRDSAIGNRLHQTLHNPPQAFISLTPLRFQHAVQGIADPIEPCMVTLNVAQQPALKFAALFAQMLRFLLRGDINRWKLDGEQRRMQIGIEQVTFGAIEGAQIAHFAVKRKQRQRLVGSAFGHALQHALQTLAGCAQDFSDAFAIQITPGVQIADHPFQL